MILLRKIQQKIHTIQKLPAQLKNTIHFIIASAIREFYKMGRAANLEGQKSSA